MQERKKRLALEPFSCSSRRTTESVPAGADIPRQASKQPEDGLDLDSSCPESLAQGQQPKALANSRPIERIGKGSGNQSCKQASGRAWHPTRERVMVETYQSGTQEISQAVKGIDRRSEEHPPRERHFVKQADFRRQRRARRRRGRRDQSSEQALRYGGKGGTTQAELRTWKHDFILLSHPLQSSFHRADLFPRNKPATSMGVRGRTFPRFASNFGRQIERCSRENGCQAIQVRRWFAIPGGHREGARYRKRFDCQRRIPPPPPPPPISRRLIRYPSDSHQRELKNFR